MKRSQFLQTALSSLLLLCGCTHTMYSHQQVMQKCPTKQEVFEQLGQPDEINPGAGIEQWTYNMDKPPLKKNKRVKDFKAMPDSLVKDSNKFIKPNKYARYVKYILKKTKNKKNNKTNNNNHTTNKKNNFGKS